MKPWLPIEEYKRRKTAEAEADMERITFLEKLDGSELLLTDWEQEFVGSFMQARSEGREQSWWTAGRRASADKMLDRYAVELGEKNGSRWQRHGPTSSPRRVEIPAANPGCCMYLVQDESGGQRPCNEAAKWRAGNGFLYCDAHGAIAREAVKRKGGHLVLSEFKPRMNAKR